MASSETTPPTLIALLLCEKIIDDRNTDTKSLIGLRSNIPATTYPWVAPSLCAYAIISGVRGLASVYFRIVRDSDDQQIVQTSAASLEIPDLFLSPELTTSFGCLCFPQPGQHALELYVNGDMVGRRRFYLPTITHSGGG